MRTSTKTGTERWLGRLATAALFAGALIWLIPLIWTVLMSVSARRAAGEPRRERRHDG